MYIRKIRLENIRGFERLHFDLSRGSRACAGWTVITGDNGSGKSALLKAIALALVGPDVARSLQPSFSGWIRHGATTGVISLGIQPTEDDGGAFADCPTELPFEACVALQNGGRDISIRDATPRNGKQRSKPERTVWSPEAAGWFSCGYGPFRRVFGASPDATRRMVSATTERYVTMYDEAASLSEADQWMRQLRHRELEGNGEARDTLRLLTDLMEDDLLPNDIRVDGVDADGLWLRDRQGVRLSWADMSDGYRSALALLADIVRHLTKRYALGGLTARNGLGQMVVAKSGVVLIDEVDAHLHPEWQREIGFWLKTRFPAIQFIVTSHSPLICQAADAHGLFVLPEPGSGDIPIRIDEEERKRVVAARPDTILLSGAFGLRNTRSEPIVQARAEWAKIRAKERAGASLSESEKKRLKRLSQQVLTDEEL